MNEIQDIKQVFDARKWEQRTQEDRKRLYAFLLCTDEHEAFVSFVQKAWRTLDVLSGHACDVFTLEHWVMPPERFQSSRYFRISGPRYGRGRIAHGSGKYSGQDVAIDNGLMLPDRTQCLEVKDKLFSNSRDIILPGLVIFPSIYTKEARYYKCSNLTEELLSESFQKIFASIQEAYLHSDDATKNFRFFEKSERLRSLRERIVKALLNLSLKDIYEVFTGGLKLVKPKNDWGDHGDG